jgi:hypothetical protein
MTTNVERTDMIHVKRVMVETWHPKGCVRISQRSDHRAQTSGFQTGPRMGIL